MITKAQKIRLGVFLSVGFMLLILFIVLVVGTKMIENRDTYYIEFSDTSVNGLQIGSDIKYHGIKIGRVEDIKIDEEDVSNVIVEISIKKTTPLKKDVEAQLVYVGITGLKQIELRGGTNEAENLPPESYIATGETLIESISGKAEVIIAKVELLLNNLNEVLNDSTKSRVNNIIGNIDYLVEENKDEISNITTNLDSLSKHLAEVTENSSEILAKINKTLDEEKLNAIVNNSVEISEDLKNADIEKITARLDSTLEQTELMIRHMDQVVVTNRDEIPEILEVLRETLDYLNEFSRLISTEPSIILKSRKKD